MSGGGAAEGKHSGAELQQCRHVYMHFAQESEDDHTVLPPGRVGALRQGFACSTTLLSTRLSLNMVRICILGTSFKLIT